MNRFQPQTVSFKKGERNIFFHILTACNLSCQHCYINPAQHGTRTLPLEVIEQWLKLFKTDQKSNVIFLGGEPTMHPDLIKAIRCAKQLGYFVTVDSNGYLFHDFLDHILPNELDFLSFSLDGPDAQINDSIRGIGSFAVCTENCRRAKELGFSTSLIYTVSRQNIDHLHRMVPLVIELGIQRFFIQVLGLRGKSATPAGNDSEQMQVTREQWLRIVPKVAEQVARAGVHVVYPKVFLAADEQFECAGRVADNYFIFPNGRVYQCPLCEDYPLHTYTIEDGVLVRNKALSETQLFTLDIAEGCVMNKLFQPDTIEYDTAQNPLFKISCCLLKQEIVPA